MFALEARRRNHRAAELTRAKREAYRSPLADAHRSGRATEERVVQLVALGLTNKAVARELFVSDRTVEGHLTRIYAKLGIQSRSELARRFAEGLSPSM